jgi:hypothetical protein
MQLFLVVLGGRIDGCHIELHDVRFVVGASIEDTLPQLRQQWFGRRRGLHIDSWVAVRAVGGWRVELGGGPSAGPEKLWFVNRGGYDPSQLAEQHTDDLHAIDDCLPITLLEGWHVHLIADASVPAQPLVPDWFGYRRIDRG